MDTAAPTRPADGAALGSSAGAQAARSDALARLEARVEASLARAQARRERVPALSYPPELPISACVDAITAAIAASPVTVVCGDTGSGKTTQLPKICLAAGRGVTGVIGHTQPRRLAARSVAARIGYELGPAGERLVGYKVRFHDRTHPDTAVKLMTDGILLAEIPADRLLLGYDTLILDEAHERSLNVDFLLGYLRRLLPRRPDLKVVITSATIDPERFARHFGGAPVIRVPGRTYPVEVRYRPLPGEDEDARAQGLEPAIVAAVDELAREGPGDVLVFLPGEREIREAAEALRKHHPPGSEVLALYARLSAAEQDRVFQTGGRRRVVLATNVAETSLTVPGIRYVVDTGLARVSRYSRRTKVQRLPVERVSRASADQRKGRCGRLGPGVCIRLYDEAEYEARPAYTDPEILRTNLAAVILRMEALGLGAVDRFPFVDPPDHRYVSDGYRLLAEIGAVDGDRRLTPLGRELARLPVDPRLARMLLAAREEGCLAEALVIVSALAVQDPRERPHDLREQADAAHRELQDPRSDFLGLLRLWDFYHGQARHLSQAKLRRLCREHFLSYVRMREWHDVHQQLLALVRDMGLPVNESPAEPEPVHRALLAGLLGQIGLRRPDGAYRGPRGVTFHLFPGSALARRGPRWVMAAELVETTRLFARTVAPIDPRWVEPLAGHLLRRAHHEPYWDPRRGEVMVFEDATLYGLPVVTRRRVRFGPVDPDAARELFIREALVAGRYRPRARFLEHNRAVRVELEALEQKVRRRDLAVDDEAEYRFYDARVPGGVWSEPALETWRRGAERQDPHCLFLAREALAGPGLPDPARFPDALPVHGARLPLAYRFEPGHEADGVTVRVPVALLGGLAAEPFEWLVPGLVEEKVIALIRSLPRPLRKHFVPAPDFARASAAALTDRSRPLVEALAGALARMTGVEAPPEAWRPETLPPHLAMRFEVLGEDGRVLASGRDLGALQGRLAQACRSALTALRWPGLPEGTLRRWGFGDLPERVVAEIGGVPVTAYPALRDLGEEVVVDVLPTPEEAQAVHARGLRRLFMLDLAPQLRELGRRLPGVDALCLAYATLPPSPWGEGAVSAGGACAGLARDLLAAVAERCFLGEGAGVRTAVEYHRRRERGRARLAEVAGSLVAQVAEALTLYREVAGRLAGPIPPGCEAGFADVRRQMAHLAYRGFVSETPARWLAELPRYLKAARRRLERLVRDPGRDAREAARVDALWAPWEHAARALRQRGRPLPEGLVEFRWLLEELRVSLFAEGFGTAVRVSASRLEREWATRIARG
jgi:ATP-dependent helicase HrpA